MSQVISGSAGGGGSGATIAEGAPMTERTKAAFEHAQATSNLLITTSGALVGLMITFSKDVVQIIGAAPLGLMAWGFYLHVISIAGGTVTHGALAGLLGRGRADDDPNVDHRDIYDWSVRGPAMVQFLGFFGGTLLMVAAAAFSIGARPAAPIGTTPLVPALVAPAGRPVEVLRQISAPCGRGGPALRRCRGFAV